MWNPIQISSLLVSVLVVTLVSLPDNNAFAGTQCALAATSSANGARSVPQTCSNRPSINIRSQSAFSSAMRNLRCGDAIYLANGVYSGNFDIKEHCHSQPVVISGTCSQDVRFKGKLNISGSGIIVSGLKTSSNTFIISGDNNKIEHNYINGGSGVGILLHRGASNNVIANNEISRLGSYGIWTKLSRSDKKVAKNNQILGNYIHDFVADSGNAAEAIQIGPGATTTKWDTNSLIKGNLIERVSVDMEIISLKASGNRVIGNTFRNSKAYVSFRHGMNNIFSKNYVDITHGVRVLGDNHQIIGNTVRGNIYIMSGDITQAQKASGHQGHPYSLNAVVNGNIAEVIDVGYAYSTPPRYPAKARSVTGNNADVRVTNGATGARSGRQRASVAAIIPLTRAQVGPNGGGGEVGCTANGAGGDPSVDTSSAAPSEMTQASSISAPQNSGSGSGSGSSSSDLAKLKEDLRIAENRLNIAQSRYRQGRIPAKNVSNREADVAAAKAALQAAQSGNASYPE